MLLPQQGKLLPRTHSKQQHLESRRSAHLLTGNPMCRVSSNTPTQPRPSHAASLTAKPRPRATDDDDDGPFDPVQSVDDWKRAAPKPRRPAVARPDIAARKAQQAEKNEALRRAEINRKKKEKKKAKKLEVREHFRQAL